MAVIDFPRLAAPLSEAAPCGPDLDMEGDPDHLAFMASVEARFPASYGAFDPTAADFAAEYATADALLRRSHDLRILAIVAKLLILDRKLEEFTNVIVCMGDLLTSQWEHVHPRPEVGDASLRMITLQTLDDMPHVVLPLQAAPILELRRLGKVSYRSYLLAAEKLPPRIIHSNDGLSERTEEVPSLSDLDQGLEKTEIPQLIAARDLLKRLGDALARLKSICIEKSGDHAALDFDRLAPMAREILEYLDGHVARRDPAAALFKPRHPGAPAEGDDATTDAGAEANYVSDIADVEGALRKLHAAADYFARQEPSSPSLLLVRQAIALVGRSFLEAIQALTPDFVEEAIIKVGSDRGFKLPITRLVANTQPPETGDGSTGEAAEESSDSYAEEASGDGDATDQSESESAEASNTGDVAQDDGATGEAAPAPAKAAAPAKPPWLKIGKRADAVTALIQVAGFYRAREPSSPIPLLLERARNMTSQDFFALAQDVLPANALKLREGD